MKLKINNVDIFLKGIKSNHLFIGIIILYLFSITLRVISINELEWFIGAEYLFEAFTQLLLGAFTSVIFYLILVYYSNYKKAQNIYEIYLIFLVGFITNYAYILMNKFDNKKIRAIDEENLLLEVRKSDKVIFNDEDKNNFVEKRLLKNTYNFLREEDLSKIDEIDNEIYKILRYIKVNSNYIFLYKQFDEIVYIKNSALKIVEQEEEYKLMIIENLKENIKECRRILDEKEDEEAYNTHMLKILEEQ